MSGSGHGPHSCAGCYASIDQNGKITRVSLPLLNDKEGFGSIKELSISLSAARISVKMGSGCGKDNFLICCEYGYQIPDRSTGKMKKYVTGCNIYTENSDTISDSKICGIVPRTSCKYSSKLLFFVD